MTTVLFLATIAIIWLSALCYPAFRQNAAIVRRSQAARARRVNEPAETERDLQVRAADIVASVVRDRGNELFREAPVVMATWLAFIAVDFKLAIEQPIEAGLLVGMAAVLRRYGRKRYTRDISERLRTRLLLAE